MPSPEAVGLGTVAMAVIAILSLFVRSLVKRQDQLFVWFTQRMNGSLDALKASLDHQSEVTIHNTKNLKAVGDLAQTIVGTLSNQIIGEIRASSEAIERSNKVLVTKIDELLERDRSRIRGHEEAS